MKAWVSVDGGGTKTRVLIQTSIKTEYRIFYRGLNYKKNENINELLTDIFAHIAEQCGLENVAHYVFGIAGIDSDTDQRYYENLISKYVIDKKLTVVNDSYLVGALTTEKNDRVVVLNGTGSNVLSYKNNKGYTNSDYALITKAGVRHITDSYLRNIKKGTTILDSLQDLVSKYQELEYDIDSSDIIKDFATAASIIVSNLEDKRCKETCKFALGSLIDSINRHSHDFIEPFNIYIYGGLFKSEPYKQLFIELLNDSKIEYKRVIHLQEEAVYGGVKMVGEHNSL